MRKRVLVGILFSAVFLWLAVRGIRWAEFSESLRCTRWIFLVPALNEELTIRDSVARLVAIPVAHRRIVVIDDASDDATPRLDVRA